MDSSSRGRLKTRVRSLQATEDAKDSRAPYGIPINQLLDNVNEKKRKQLGTPSSRTEPKAKRRKAPSVETKLLSEKYRPQNFFDLLGNDDANRRVLKWLHYWKSCVFGTPPDLCEHTDRLGRPIHRILLLNGPPGVGKTTAAHVIAHQAGFDVLEINASDERGAAVVKDRIVSAIQSHRVLSTHPVAIIADEVEGAAEHGFLKALLEILADDTKALTGQQTSSRKSGKAKPKLLLRPIIAICNDVWSPNLHGLRQHSEIVFFNKQPPSRLLKRLEQICLDEGVKTSTQKLSRVAEQCNYDLRACLNAVQFGNRASSDESTQDSVELVDWSSLVKMQFLGKRPATFQHLESCSDPDKLVNGCFTAYLESTESNETLKAPKMIGDLLALSDVRRSNTELKAFMAHAFGHLFRSPEVMALRSRASQGESKVLGKPPSLYETTKRTKSIVATVLRMSSPSIRLRSSESTFLMELLPLALNISSPTVRTTPTPDDKIRLKSIASTLCDIGLRLRTEKIESGAYVHRIDPPIEMACILDAKRRSDVSLGKYISRSLIKDAMQELTRIKLPTKQTVPARPQSEVQIKARAPLDLSAYFGLKKPDSSTQIQRDNEQRSRKVWVQFSEGFSNAVRKPVTWSELFGS